MTRGSHLRLLYVTLATVACGGGSDGSGGNSQGERPSANVAPDLYARFDDARFRRPVDLADCLSEP